MIGLLLVLLLGMLTCQVQSSRKGIIALVTEIKSISTTSTPKELNVVFVVDGSSSINQNDWALMRVILQTFIESITSPNVKIGVVVFSTFPQVLIPLGPNPNLENIKNLIQPLGSTATKEALVEAYNMLRTGQGMDKIIILLTDGQPNVSPQMVANEIKNSGIQLCSLGFGSINEDHLKELSDCYDIGTNFNSIVQLIRSALQTSSTFEYLRLQVYFKTDQETFSFDETIPLKINVLNNNGQSDIPKGYMLKFKEASRIPGIEHFYPSTYTFDSTIKKGTNSEITIMLVPNVPTATAKTIPEFINWELCDLNRQSLVKGNIALKSELFLKDLMSEIDEISEFVNIILLGPYGSGKSTLLNNINTCLSKDKYKNIIFTVCDGIEHCTTKLSSRNMIERIKIFDTVGFDSENYKSKYLNAILEGRVKDHLTEDNFFNNPVERPDELHLKNVVHVPIVVVSQDFYQYEKDSKEVKELRERLKILKDYGYSPVIAITKMDLVQDQTMYKAMLSVSEGIPNLIGLSTIPYPISTYPELRERVFETDIQVLELLYGAVKSGVTWQTKPSIPGYDCSQRDVCHKDKMKTDM